MAVTVITDSASDLPADLANELGISVVPCNVHFGTEDFKDRVDLSSDDFYDRLVNGDVFPKTSQPSPGEFVELYESAAKGADGIVSVHVSSKLSGTYNSAIQAKGMVEVDCPIEVVDSYQACMGQGVVAVAAAKVAAAGGGVSEVAVAAKNAANRAQLVFLLDTLEYLEKGGRIGKASAFLGGILRIKPLIKVTDGEVHGLSRARSMAQAMGKLTGEAEASAPLEEACVVYTTTPDEAAEFAESLRGLMVEGATPLVTRAGPTIGTYAGPGAMGIGFLQAKK